MTYDPRDKDRSRAPRMAPFAGSAVAFGLAVVALIAWYPANKPAAVAAKTDAASPGEEPAADLPIAATASEPPPRVSPPAVLPAAIAPPLAATPAPAPARVIAPPPKPVAAPQPVPAPPLRGGSLPKERPAIVEPAGPPPLRVPAKTVQPLTPPTPPRPAPVAAAAKLPVAPAAAAPPGSIILQLAAAPDRAQADALLTKASSRYGDALRGRTKRLEPVQKGSTTLYRAQFTGFASAAEAKTACGAIKAAGGDCLVRTAP